MLIAHVVVHTISSFPNAWGHLLAHYPAGSGPGGTNLDNGELSAFLKDIAQTLFSLGLVLCVIGIIVGGIMRATAFGSERRIAASNVALSCAVLGFLIILLAQPIGNAIQSAFP
jgi:type IV secretory pathway VirB2 component (pilin)